jgi:hypothetical protein
VFRDQIAFRLFIGHQRLNFKKYFWYKNISHIQWDLTVSLDGIFSQPNKALLCEATLVASQRGEP